MDSRTSSAWLAASEGDAVEMKGCFEDDSDRGREFEELENAKLLRRKGPVVRLKKYEFSAAGDPEDDNDEIGELDERFDFVEHPPDPEMAADADKSLPRNGTDASGKKRATDIPDLIGGDGPWQRRIFLVMLFISIPAATHNLAMSFLAPNQDHWCARPREAQNLSLQQWKSVGLPPEDPVCSRYAYVNLSHPRSPSNDTGEDLSVTPCHSWEYDEEFYSSTLVSQWNLVCERKWLVSMSKSIFMVGTMISVTIFGQLADKMGRRPVVAASSFLVVCSAVVCAFSTSFSMFIVTRFLLALGLSGCYNTSFVLVMETVSPELRSIYGVAVQFGWCLGFVSLPAIAWLLRDWFWIQVTLTGPCLILLASWWMLPESPRWLLSQGRVDKAQKILTKAASINGVKLSETLLKKVMTKATEEHESDEPKSTFLTLFKTAGLRQTTISMYYIWFATAFVYYGLSYNTNELAGDPFINFALSGAVEFPSYFLTIFAIKYLGRKKPLAATLTFGGAACLLAYPLPTDPWWMSVSVLMVGKFCVTSSFAIIYIYTAELLPTVVRNIGLGSASFCSRFGSILAPFVRELGDATHPVVPQIVFGVLAVVAGFLVLILPETNNRSVPDTFKEAAEMSKNLYKKKKEQQNGNHVVITLSKGEEPTLLEHGEENAVFAPSPTQKKKKLADVPEEDSHCEDEDNDHPDKDEQIVRAETISVQERPDLISETAVADTKEVVDEEDEVKEEEENSTPEVEVGKKLGNFEVSEIFDTRESENIEQRSEL